jgi:hypothetical protein
MARGNQYFVFVRDHTNQNWEFLDSYKFTSLTGKEAKKEAVYRAVEDNVVPDHIEMFAINSQEITPMYVPTAVPDAEQDAQEILPDMRGVTKEEFMKEHPDNR